MLYNNTMNLHKKCPNCGAKNDLLLTTCMFCNSHLSEVNLESVPSEDIIQNAKEWISKLGSSFIYFEKNVNEWIGKESVTYNANQIEGLAQKYLYILQTRCINNQKIKLVYTDLKSEFDQKRKGLLYKMGGGDKEKGYTFLYTLIFFLVMLLIPIILSIAFD